MIGKVTAWFSRLSQWFWHGPPEPPMTFEEKRGWRVQRVTLQWLDASGATQHEAWFECQFVWGGFYGERQWVSYTDGGSSAKRFSSFAGAWEHGARAHARRQYEVIA